MLASILITTIYHSQLQISSCICTWSSSDVPGSIATAGKVCNKRKETKNKKIKDKKSEISECITKKSKMNVKKVNAIM